MKVNIIVLNYNGETLVPECIPSIIAAKHASQYQVNITVIDNESTDRSLEALGRFGSEIKVVKHKNEVFCSYYDIVKDQPEEIAVLLNNDMKVDPGFIDPMVKVFESKEDAFLAAPKCYNYDGTALEGGRSKGFIKFGWFGALARYPGWEEELDRPDHTFQSGFGAVRKDRFLALGGYPRLYLPGRLEDSDICFRAWKRGWACYYEPASVVYHKGGESFKKAFGVKGISAIDSRNSLLFFWKNISYWKYWLMHVLFLPLRLARWAARGETGAVKGCFEAFTRIPDVLKARAAEKKTRCARSDREIFGMFR
ncbi:MAG: glycosyltransferase family 2 protein [Candidatus Omnitrophota bacterium]